ncbi:gfo/Idh/MocA family oxidoreductase [Nonomuraea phyllanthi]|uniref:Gfo/Idh/MocA family oxidoreductase n=1 Tax=Nonomuraea phyllanthi TaxID=2219224 RepID=A0A5C4VVP8_9ACTN|nr:Gfo/Idh/MocA family oxidoreductase [Nonomuraea phyllanthi]KAB8190275.1 gfo/Idh/MocA family oxidoreductase [Nonomuraea phyllanthi]
MTHLPELRIGIVGAGLMGRGHAEVLAAHPQTEITAVARRPLDHAPGARVFPGYQELLDSGTVDAVSITTPDHLHADVMVAAARAGVHILVEKPFTTTVADADRAVAAIRSAGVVAMCLFNHRWVPAYAQAKEQMRAVGEPVVGYARKDDTIYVPTEMLDWADRTTCAWFLSSHDIDLMTWLYDDEVVEVFATARYGKLRGRGIDTPDAMQIQARFGRGAVATFESAWIYPNTFPTMVDSYVTVAGESGVIQLDRQKENIQLATEDGYTYPRNMLQRVVHGVPAGAYRDAIHHFVDCAITGTEPLISVESSRHVTAVLEAAHESARTGRPVKL